VIPPLMPKPNIPAWWSASSVEQRRQHLKACGLDENLASKSWGGLSRKEQAAVRRKYHETHEDDGD
jgi:hypothetical protein